MNSWAATDQVWMCMATRLVMPMEARSSVNQVTTSSDPAW